MKPYIIYAGISLFFAVACNPSKQMQMNSTEKSAQRGFHANQANKIIDKNAANRKANQKAAEKNRQAVNKQATNQKAASTGVNSGTFNFY